MATREAPDQASALFNLDAPPANLREASQAELAERESEWARAEADLGASGILELQDLSLDRRPPAWRGPLIAIGTLTAAVAVLIVFAQAAALLNQIQELPAWAQIPATVGVVLLIAAVVASLGRLMWVFAKLGRSPRVSTRALRELAERAEMRAQSLQRSAEAKRQLYALLKAYPLSRGKDRIRLSRLGLTPEEIARLQAAQKSLLRDDAGGDAAWIEQFERLFLGILDEAARRRITRCAWLVGLKTAAVPGGGFDAAIVLINAYLLTADICTIYNVRSGPLGTATILVHVLVNALAASQIEDLTTAATDHWANQLSQHLGGVAAGLTTIAGKLTARVGDGAINALLTRRLGTVAMRQIRPIELTRG
jgi:uncharacterized membrane protein YcjF (UPF0283 family)